MEQEAIKRHEHDEFAKRMEAEHTRQNERISELEDNVKQLGNLTISVKELAISMHQMLEEQKTQGKRLEVLESRDGEMWRTIMSYIATAVVGAIVCYALAKIGL